METTATETSVVHPKPEPERIENETLESSVPPRTSLLNLVRLLTGDFRTFIRQEIQLAKTELSEKASRLGRNAAALAAGGAVAYAGLIVFLLGLGWLLAWAYHLAGLNPLFAAFLGLITIGLLSIAIGSVLLLMGLRTISQESLAPQRTLHTLQEFKGSQRPQQAPSDDTKASSAEMQSRVEATEDHMGATLDELGRRLSPQHINAEVKQRIQSNPYRAGLIAMGAGLLSGLLLRRKFQRA